MPVQSGPTMYLPYSHHYLPGYLAWRLPEFHDHFVDHHVQLPLAKGDAVFFNPALFHGAGSNVSADVQRMANLLQISSAFGRAMEQIDRTKTTKAIYPALATRRASGMPLPLLANAVAATTRIPFPTNLDRDQPVGGLTPLAQTDIVLDTLVKGVGVAELSDRLDRLYAARRQTSDIERAVAAGQGSPRQRGDAGRGHGRRPRCGQFRRHRCITGRRRDVGERMERQLREIGSDDAWFLPTDVADITQAQDSVRHTTFKQCRRIDSLVNAAGLTTRGTLLGTTPELFDAHVAVNLRAPFFLMQAAVADMLRRSSAGTIVNIITMSAHGGQPHLAPYARADPGLIGLTRNAAHTHRWDRIRINGVNIGWTETEGEDKIQRTCHCAQDDWLELAAKSMPMGKLGRVDRRVGRLPVI